MKKTSFNSERTTLWHKKLSGFLMVLLLLMAGSVKAQTLDVGASKYVFNNNVNAIVKDATGNTYVGGEFTKVGLWSGNGVQLNSSTGVQDTAFAKVAGGDIRAVVPIPSGGWYIGGTFTTVNGITRIRLARINADGTLHAFDPNMDDNVNTLALDGSGNLYAGGDFTTVGGSTTRNHLCKFDNTGALMAFDPNMNSSVSTLTLDGSGNLYAGGGFTTVGGSTTRNRLCKFDNTGALTAFDPNLDSRVRALALDGGNLYVGGEFTTVGGSTTRNYLCEFDNTGALMAFDPNMNYFVYALALDGGNLYVGGEFTAVGGSTTRNRLCQFDNTGALTAFDPNMNSGVGTLTLDGGNLYAGGAFTTVGGSMTRNYLCKFDNTGALTAFDPKLNGSVGALAIDGGNLYVGGGFTAIYNTTRNRLCKFDNTGDLTAFDPNLNGSVNALALDGGNLYVGGGFTTVGGSTTRNYLCKFDNTGALTPFDPNISFVNQRIGAAVLALVVDGSGNLYAGGNFITVGGTARNRLCQFDNTGALTAFNPNMNRTVTSLALDGGNLYAGGFFTTVGGSTTRNRLCKFDNTGALTAFDPNIDGSVRALSLDGSGNLYAGGDFTTVGGSTTRNHLCKFDNTGALTAFDPNMDGSVRALALDGSGNLYAGGDFITVGGSTARNRLCKFDNTGALTAFDPNMNNSVLVLAVGSGRLYVGGVFASPTINLAIYVIPCTTPFAFNVTGGGAYCAGGAGVTIGLASSETGITYQLMNGASNIGSPVSGTGSAISFGNQTAAGTYTVLATRTAGGCTATMTGNQTISINSAPIAGITGTASGCGNLTLTATGGSSYAWSNGTNTAGVTLLASGSYTVTVTDANNCTSTASVVTTVTDTQAPVIVCPVNQSLTATGAATLPNYASMATATDNCAGGVTVTQMPAPGTVFSSTGMVNVTLTARDASMNMSTCIFDVNITVTPGQAYTRGGDLPCNYKTLTNLGPVPASNGGTTNCFSVLGNNIGATLFNDPRTCGTTGDKGVFYHFRMPSCGTTPGVRISTNNAGTSMLGTNVAVYTVTNPGNCAYVSYQLVACSGSSTVTGCSGASGSMDHGTLEFAQGALVNGGAYYIYVSGDNGSEGNFELTFEYIQSAGISVTAGATPGQAVVTMPANGQSKFKVQWRPVGSTGWATSALLTGLSYTLPANSLMPGVPYEFRALYQCAGTNWVLMSSDIVNFATTPTVATCARVSGLSCNNISGSVTTTWSPVPAGTGPRITVALRNGATNFGGTTLASTVTSVVFANRPNATSMQVQSNCGGAAYIAYSNCTVLASGQAAAVVPVTFEYNGITYDGIDFNDPQWGLFGAQPEGDFEMSVTNGQLIITDESVKVSGFDFELRPSVAMDFTNVVISTQKTVDAQLSLSDMNGSIFETRTIKGVQNGTVVTLETSEMPAGLYIVSIRTEEGNVAKKLVVVK